MSNPLSPLSDWRVLRRHASVRAIDLLIIMLVMAMLLGSDWAGGARFSIVCLGAVLAWVAGVRLVAAEMGLVGLARRHRLRVGWHQRNVVILAVLAFACEAASAAGITGLLFLGQVHGQAVVLALEFGTLAVLWNEFVVSRGGQRIAFDLSPQTEEPA